MANEDLDLNDVFDDEPKAEEETEQSEVETETEDVKGEEETSETEEETEEAEPPSAQEPTLVPIAALKDERRKAQDLKEEVKSLKSQIPQADSAPDPYDDLEGYNEFMRNQWEQEQIQKQTAEFAEIVEDSRKVMLENHEDFPQMEELFYVLANQNEDLKQEMFKSPDPAKYAYDASKSYLQAQKDTLLAEINAENTTETEEVPKNPALKAPSLATATAQASNSAPVEKEEALEDLFGDQAY